MKALKLGETKVSDDNMPVGALNFNIWMAALMSCTRERLLTCVLGGRYGYGTSSYLDQESSKMHATIEKKPSFGSLMQQSSLLGVLGILNLLLL